MVLDNLVGWEEFFLKLYITAPVHPSETVHTRNYHSTVCSECYFEREKSVISNKIGDPLMSKYLSNSISNSAFCLLKTEK